MEHLGGVGGGSGLHQAAELWEQGVHGGGVVSGGEDGTGGDGARWGCTGGRGSQSTVDAVGLSLERTGSVECRE